MSFPDIGATGHLPLTDTVSVAVECVSNRCSLPGHVYVQLGAHGPTVVIHHGDVVWASA